MANVIKILRSSTTSTPSALAEGELAYSEGVGGSGNLFIGTAGGNIEKIGGLTDVQKLAAIEDGAEVNVVLKVAGRTGEVTLVKADVGLGNADNTSDADKPISTLQQSGLDDKLDKAGGTLTGFLILNGDPTNPLHAATKAYVDAVSTGLSVKDAVKAATTGNITLSGTQTVDGVALIANDRVLVKDQTAAAANGIYVVATGAWTRSTDADENSEVTSGLYVFIEGGSTNGSSGWMLTTANPIIVDTTALTFSQFSGGSTFSAGTGIDITGAVISVKDIPADKITSGTLPLARLDASVLLDTSTIDGGTF